MLAEMLAPVPVHVSPVLAPAERGEEFGAALADRVRVSVDGYGALYATMGLSLDDVAAAAREYRAWMQRHTPALLRELDAMAGGASVDAADLVALNARTELLAVASQRRAGPTAASECSTLAGTSPEHGPWLVQNWDWFASQAAARVAWIVPLADDHWFATFTEAGLLAKIGLNSHGVAVGLNLLRSTADGKRGAGMPVHVALRLLHESAANWADAVATLQSATWTASSCITVAATAEGVAYAVEVSPDGVGIVGPDPDGVVRHTNHFLTGVAQEMPPDPAMPSTSVARLACLATAPEPGGAAEWAEEALTGHVDDGAVCSHAPGIDGGTLARITLIPAGPTLRFTAGPPCEGAITDVPLGRARQAAALT